MKNILTWFFISAVSLVILPSSVMAAGSFELNDFPESFTAVAGEKFQAYINFIYSGPEYRLGVSITGKKLPDDVKLGYIEYGANGVNSILYSGIPKEVGDYSLNLVLTDNYGIVLTKHFVFKVSGLVFRNDSLPNATLNKPYTANINFTYPGKSTPLLSITTFPEGVSFDFTNFNGNDGFFPLKLTPRKVGQFTFKTEVTVNGVSVGTKIFSLTVNDPNQTPPAPILLNSPPPAPDPVPASPVFVAPPTTTATQKSTPKKIESPKPAVKKYDVVNNVEIETASTSHSIATSTAENIQESTSTSTIVTPFPVEVKKENFFIRVWKKFLSWF